MGRRSVADGHEKPPPGRQRTPMIGKLTGTLLEKNPPEVLVDCGGVGYEVQVPMSTFYNLPASGAKVSLLTHFVVREDAQLLYGFGTHSERQAFRELIKITGIGPRMAQSVFVNNDQNDIVQALMALGYSDKDAAAALKKLPPDVGVTEGIKLALKALAK